MEFYSTIENETMWFEGKWVQLKDIMKQARLRKINEFLLAIPFRKVLRISDILLWNENLANLFFHFDFLIPNVTSVAFTFLQTSSRAMQFLNIFMIL
jgi:hypothetical protein